MTEKLERTLAIANNTDPFGKRWTVMFNRAKGLYSIASLEENGPEIPRSYPKDSGLESLFTKPVVAEEFIKLYLTKAWDWNDKQEKQAPAKERAKTYKEEAA